MDYRKNKNKKIIDLNKFLDGKESIGSDNDEKTADFDEQLHLFKENINFNPFDHKHFLLIADFCIQKNMHSEAINYLKQAKQINSNSPDIYYKLGIIYYSFKHYDFAKEEFLKVLELNPENVYSYLNLTNIFLKENLLIEAEHILKKGVNYNPNDKLLLNNYGVVLARLQKYDEAIKIWEKLESLVPDEVEAKYNLAITYSKMGMVEIAISKFKKIIKKVKDDFGVFANLASLYEKKHDFENAQKMYREALKLEPDNYGVLSSFGLMQAKKGNYNEAIKIYREICRKEPGNVKNLMNLSMIYAVQGKYSQAVSILSEAEKDEHSDPEVMLNLAINYSNMDDFEKASLYFEKTIKLNPNNQEPYLHFSKYLLQKNEYAFAAEVLKKGCDRIEDNLSLKYLYAKALFKSGRYNEASSSLINLIKKHPDNYAAYELLIKLYRHKKRYSRILLIYEEAVKNIENNPRLFIDYGVELVENNQHEKGIIFLQKAEKITPKNQKMYYYLFVAFKKTDNKQEAEKYKQKCININPFSSWAKKID
ncbi:MAG: tetratricopeptide repeat protein [Candidatus Muiribacteriota bacterium]